MIQKLGNRRGNRRARRKAIWDVRIVGRTAEDHNAMRGRLEAVSED